MADIGTGLKNFWLKGMEAIGNAASNIASNTKSKVDEMNLVNRRAEILREFGNQAYALFLKGERFPEELEAQLRELIKLDDQLNDLRAERLAGVKAAETASEEAKDAAVTEANDSDGSVAVEEADSGAQPETEAPEEEISSPAEQKTDESPEAQAVPVIQVIQEETEPAKDSSLSSAINDLFESAPAKEASGKVSDALDSLEDSLKKFSDEMDRKVDEIAEKLSE